MKKKNTRPRIPPKELRAIWDKVPKMVDCKGLCSDSCGPIPALSIERKLAEERSGKELGVDRQGTCTLLANGLCTVYAIRPLICRIWGVTDRLPCVHGCRPEHTMTDAEALVLFAELEALSGDADATNAIEEMLMRMSPIQRREWRAERDAWHRKWSQDDVLAGS